MKLHTTPAGFSAWDKYKLILIVAGEPDSFFFIRKLEFITLKDLKLFSERKNENQSDMSNREKDVQEKLHKKKRSSK